jgi:chorismate mutase / prephenate dehydratase
MAGEHNGMGLDELRAEIDQIDRELVDLLDRRARVSERVGQVKRAQAEPDQAIEIYQPDREAQVLQRAVAQSKGPLSEAALRGIYREILSASRELQRRLRVGYLGPIATFAFEAATRQFGSSATLVPCRTIADVFLETQRRDVDYGVVPVENSTGGVVAHTLDQLLESDLQVCAQIQLPVSFTLASKGPLAGITRVYSHPQAFAQCRRWLAENLPGATQLETASTAAAAEMAQDPESAAIATEGAAELYGLPVLARRIEDVATNVTRFLVIGQHASGPTGRDQTAVVFGVNDRVGALQDALRSLAENGINLTRIESRPSRRRIWEYVFFVDLDGHPEDEAVARALVGLRASCSFVRVLGAWPA